LNLISESLFKDSGKKLGVGCASVTALQQDQVEDADQIYHRIRNVADKAGERNLAYAHPDCGLRGVPLEVSELILHRLSEAVTRYNSGL
jgi:methionine synthase II (cobalamin-independent)